MDMNSDSGLLVVDIEHCVPADSRHLGKSSCVYSTTLPTAHCQDLQLTTPLQCLTDLNQSLCRIQNQHLSHLPVHYQPIQVNYEGNIGNDESISPIYQNSSLESFSPSYQGGFLPSVPTPSQAPQCAEDNSPPPPPPPPPVPKLRKRLPPPDPNNVPRFPINEYEYYKEIEELLLSEKYPVGVSENYKAHLKKRARHYLVIDKELYHNEKNPKKVIMRKEDQNKLLEYNHVSSLSGIHLGIKKMMDCITSKYFWRGLYEDVANFVNSCPQCRDVVDVAQQREKEARCLDEESEDDPGLSTVVMSIQTSSTVWKRVEIQVHGPFKLTTSRNEFVVTITDPESCFIQAAPLPRNGCSTKLTDYILKTFYTFGFPEPFFVGDKALFEVVSTEFDWRLKQTAWKRKLIWKENPDCSWVSQLTELLIMRKSERWDREMDRFMFQFRAGSIRDAFSPPDSTPFYSMFQRAPYQENKENHDFRKMGKKKMHKNPVKCEHCDDVFTSKVSLKLHNKCHRAEEERSDVLLKESNKNGENPSGSLSPEVVGESVEVAMSELKTFLDNTRDVRRKRGKYRKYSVELQERMISYALKHGPGKTSAYFSQLIGSHVSDSTIRNLLRSSINFHPRMKEEIARFAEEFGVEKASNHFTEKLSKEVSISLVKKFKAIYGNKFKKKEDKVGANVKAKKGNRSRSIIHLDEKEKDKIGSFACEHSFEETVKHFLEKDNITLNTNDVQSCHKQFLDKSPNMELVNIQEGVNNLQTITYQAVSLTEGNACFSSADSFVHINEGTYDYHNVSYQTETTQVEVAVQDSMENNSEVQNRYFFVSQEGTPPFEVSVLTEEDSGEELRNAQVQDQDPQESCITESESHENPPEPIESPQPNPTPKVKKKTKKKESGKKRGNYMTYSPELRAKMGKYAAENGSFKASAYFSKILGHNLPESTARGLKEKYLNKMRHCDVTSLGYSPRGRPLRLGKYDEVVQECLKELVSSGERLTSFLAITTAKQILTKLEPSLLQENGGPVVLNSTWAKSFLKRIGVRNNS